MSAKKNLSQAMQDMFGVGGSSNTETTAVETANAAAEVEAPTNEAGESTLSKVYGSTFIADGVVIEGKINAKGNLEIAGLVKGDIDCEGSVIIKNDLFGNVKSAGLAIMSSKLTGDVTVEGDVSIDSSAIVKGNIHANNLDVSGKVMGDIDCNGNISVSDQAQIIGNIRMNTITISKGAKISGSMETISLQD